MPCADLVAATWCAQEVVAGREDDPEGALQAAGLYCAYDAAVVWVTPAQLAELRAELAAMEGPHAMELTAYYVQAPLSPTSD